MDTATDLDEIFEMANLSEARTGIPGVVHVSTRVGQHGPRVKYYLRRPDDNQESFSVSITDAPRVVISSLPERVVRRMSPLVIAWVRLNRVELLDFWNNGRNWMDEEVTAFKAGLRKLAAED